MIAFNYQKIFAFSGSFKCGIPIIKFWMYFFDMQTGSFTSSLLVTWELQRERDISITCTTLSFVFSSIFNQYQQYFEPHRHWKCIPANVLEDFKYVYLLTGSLQRSVYTARELEYAFFVHSLCVLGKVLIYANGRKLFPIKLRKRKGTILICSLISKVAISLEALWGWK